MPKQEPPTKRVIVKGLAAQRRGYALICLISVCVCLLCDLAKRFGFLAVSPPYSTEKFGEGPQHYYKALDILSGLMVVSVIVGTASFVLVIGTIVFDGWQFARLESDLNKKKLNKDFDDFLYQTENEQFIGRF